MTMRRRRMTDPTSANKGHVVRQEGESATMKKLRVDSGTVLVLWLVQLPVFCYLQPTTTLPAGVKVVPLDVFICMDSSSSMGEENYDSLKTAVCDFLHRLPVDERQIRVGVRPFSWALSEQYVSLTGNATQLFANVTELPYMRGRTRTDLAIEDAIQQLLDHGRPGVAKVIIVLTDGMPTYPSEAMRMAERAAALNIEMYVVGFGSLVSALGLYSLAHEENVYRQQSFDQLPEELLSYARIQMLSQENTTGKPNTSSASVDRIAILESNTTTSSAASITMTTTTTTASSARSTTRTVLYPTSTQVNSNEESSPGVQESIPALISSTTTTGNPAAQSSTGITLPESGTTSLGSITTSAAETTTAAVGIISFRTAATGTARSEANATPSGSGTSTSQQTTTPSGSGTSTSQQTTTPSGSGTSTSQQTTTPSGSGTSTSQQTTLEKGTITTFNPFLTTGDQLTTQTTTATTSGIAEDINSKTGTVNWNITTAVLTESRRTATTTESFASTGQPGISQAGTDLQTSTGGDTRPTDSYTRVTVINTGTTDGSFRTTRANFNTTESDANTTLLGPVIDLTSRGDPTINRFSRITSPHTNHSTTSHPLGSTSHFWSLGTSTPRTSETMTTRNPQGQSSETTSTATASPVNNRTTPSKEDCKEDYDVDYDTGRSTQGGDSKSGQGGRSGCRQRQSKGGLCDKPGLKMNGGIGYVRHPFNCARYIQCYRQADGAVTAVTRICAPGLLWNHKSLRCDPAWEVRCNTDLCQHFSIAHHYMEGNCRAFWQCQNGRSLPAYCSGGQAYFSGQGCLPSMSCKDVCPLIAKSQWPCIKRPDPGSPTNYIVDLGAFSCLRNTCTLGFFDVSRCACSLEEIFQSECTPHFSTSFDDRGTYSNGATAMTNIVNGTNVGIFFGNSQISIPMTFADILSRKAERPLRMSFFYKELSALGYGESQLLVQSSPCVFGGMVLIYFDTMAIRVRLFKQQREVASTELFTEGFSVSSWKNMQLKYWSSGFVISASSGKLLYTSFVKVPAELTVSECGWTFGHPDKDDHISAFTGSLDDIQISYC